MRLSFISSSGQSMDISTAIKQDPFAVRVLLLDALFQCRTRLPDTLNYIRAEQEVRDTLLLHFKSDQERYVKSYCLSRNLDQRTQATPRAQVIYQAFHYGGPVALLGIFYATLDAHRNVRNRETLEFFLQKTSEESKFDLMKRAGGFPCKELVASWLYRIFEKLETDSQVLIRILRYLGTTKIPLEIFRRARLPSLSWDSSGEVASLVSRVSTVILVEELFNEAVQNLNHVGFLHLTQETISLDEKVADLLQQHLEGAKWVVEAAKVVIHAFPKSRDIEPSSYVQQCELLMPQWEFVFNLNTRIIPFLDQTNLMQLTEAGLSASNFRGQSWKIHAVKIATEAAKALKSDLPEKGVYVALAEVRRACVAHLYRAQSEAGTISFPIYDSRSNAFSSHLLIVKAREHVSSNTNTLVSALEHLNSFNPVWHGATSQLGNMQGREISLMRAKVLRYSGRFQEAYDTSAALAPQGARVNLQRCYALCELGKSDEAIRVLYMEPIRDSGNLLYVKLARAHAHLIKCMQTYSTEQKLDWRALQESRSIYQDLRSYTFPDTYYGKTDHLSVLLGVAITEHLDGQVDAALRAWQAVSATSQVFLSTGYTDMIFAYSTSELQMRRGAKPQSEILRNYAKILFARTGRQHHFVGLGSYWPDIVSSWFVAQGQDPVVPAQ